MIRILFLGDIVGRTGSSAVLRMLPQLKEEFRPDFVLANVENISEGFGVTREEVSPVLAAGVDACTTGNHVFDRPGYEHVFDGDLSVVRPANWPGNVPGRGDVIVEKDGKRLLLMNILGRTFMFPAADDPFEAADRILDERRGAYDVSVLDVHAETTSEKRALAEHLDGRVNLVAGTHTHVQTNDARTLPRGTGFLTDIGMCGPERSIIGFDIDVYTRRMRTGVHEHADVPEGASEVCAVLATVDNGRTDVQIIRRSASA